MTSAVTPIIGYILFGFIALVMRFAQLKLFSIDSELRKGRKPRETRKE
jgi:hypothetical protein